jgi:AraC-like DNA-binding protein
MRMDVNRAIEQIGQELAADITRQVVAAVRPEVEKIRDSRQLGWTEEQLAVELGISEETLARIAKRNEIGFSYSIPPTRFDKDKKPQNGRRFYLRHHVLNYLMRLEVPAKVKGSQDVRFENVYQFDQKAA